MGPEWVQDFGHCGRMGVIVKGRSKGSVRRLMEQLKLHQKCPRLPQASAQVQAHADLIFTRLSSGCPAPEVTIPPCRLVSGQRPTCSPVPPGSLLPYMVHLMKGTLALLSPPASSAVCTLPGPPRVTSSFSFTGVPPPHRCLPAGACTLLMPSLTSPAHPLIPFPAPFSSHSH